jgi:hypothetical protein
LTAEVVNEAEEPRMAAREVSGAAGEIAGMVDADVKVWMARFLVVTVARNGTTLEVDH